MIRHEINVALAQYGMLPDMPIRGGNFPETTIHRNVFFPAVSQDKGLIFNRYIAGDVWVRHAYTQEPTIVRVIAWPQDGDKLTDLVFYLLAGELIPLDFRPENVGMEGIR